MTVPELPAREQRRLATRAELERAALELVGERGFEGATVAEIARRAGVAERTFFLHFASKEDVVLGDLHAEFDAMRRVLTEPTDGRPVLELFRDLGHQRVEHFRAHTEQVRARRAIEDAHPSVHSRALAVRERAEADLLGPRFAADLRTTPDDHRVRLLLAAFSGISAALDGLFEQAPDDAAARRVLDDAVTAVQAAMRALART